MAKKRKVTIGSILKGRDGKPDYIKVTPEFEKIFGKYINLENEKTQLADLDKAVADEKLSEDYAQTRKEQVSQFWNKDTQFGKKLKEVIRFQLTALIED
jgi:aminoglycoside/choline kinase family phosphotransferase